MRYNSISFLRFTLHLTPGCVFFDCHAFWNFFAHSSIRIEQSERRKERNSNVTREHESQVRIDSFMPLRRPLLVSLRPRCSPCNMRVRNERSQPKASGSSPEAVLEPPAHLLQVAHTTSTGRLSSLCLEAPVIRPKLSRGIATLAAS